ncbi:MAG: hypothetical protein IKT21_05235 [Methanomicrobium sp.]|nr:hypothetical protein [Methanomicrobium sp.]
MPDYVYEKNLYGMKLNVLACPNQDRITAEIAGILGVNKQVLRRFLIEQLDMAYLENIPARYESRQNFYGKTNEATDETKAKTESTPETAPEKLPIVALFTDYLPVETGEIAKVQGKYDGLIKSGAGKEDAEKECIRLIAAIVSDAKNQPQSSEKSNLRKNSAPRYTGDKE